MGMLIIPTDITLQLMWQQTIIMEHLLYVSVALIFTFQTADAVACYTCKDVTDESLCTRNTTTCGTGQVCYKLIRLVNSAELTTLGCKNNNECSIGIVGRSLYRRRSHACMECCSTAFCNALVCKQRLPTDCSEAKLINPEAEDGVYEVMLWKTHRTIQVYCDMTTDGGGWTVFQNRYDGSVDFYRNYSQYVHGFGDLNSEFWLGLDYIQEMTSQHENNLRIDLMASNGTTAYETFRPFSLSLPNYVLHVGNTTSSKNSKFGSSYRFGPEHNGQPFSTYDNDVDQSGDNCATYFHGAWWYLNCYYANLNGQYLTPGTTDNNGMTYHSFILSTSLQQSRMAFRRS